MFHLVASDLDGTLLDGQHRLSSSTKASLRHLHRHGIHFAFATGRHHLDVAKLQQYVDIPSYMITSNGACIHSPEGRVAYQNFILEDVCLRIIQLFRDEPEVRVHIYTPSGWHCSDYEPLMAGQNNQSGFTPTRFDMTLPPLQKVLKIFVTCRNTTLLRNYASKCHRDFGNSVSMTSSGIHFLEFNAPQVSKGHALAFVAKQLGIDIRDTLAFGDSMNDLSMLKTAGRGLITSNADSRLIKAIPHLEVIGHHADDAVAKYLDSLLTSITVPEYD